MFFVVSTNHALTGGAKGGKYERLSSLQFRWPLFHYLLYHAKRRRPLGTRPICSIGTARLARNAFLASKLWSIQFFSVLPTFPIH